MKRIYTLLLLLLPFYILLAQKNDFTGYKIFINPGHGGYDSDDRHVVETDFWESEGNLSKGLYLKTLLDKLNATTYISRTTNTTEDDLALSAISAMANTANADITLSIHSNALSGKYNYPLILYRGYDDQPVFPKAKDFAAILFNKLIEKSNFWTRTSVYIKGDWTFYPSWGDKVGLGVLRNLTMPGILSEGSFHDYIAESWRLRNADYLKHEAVAFTRALMEFDAVQTFSHGVIAGVVSDPLEKPGYYVAEGGLDEKLPLNNVKVSIEGISHTYTTDNLNNGFFYFDSIPPGDYKLYFEGPAKYLKDSLELTVVSNKTTVADKELRLDTTLVPEVTGLSPFQSIDVPLNQEWMLSFSMPMLPDSFAKAVSIAPSVSLRYTWSDNNRKVSIRAETFYTKNTGYTISISSRACSRWKVKMAQPYVFSFQTIDRTTLLLEKSFPADGKNEISLLPQFRLYFDAPLDQTSASNNILLYDASNNLVSKAREEFVTHAGKGAFYFEPQAALLLNSDYKLVLKSDLTDHAGAKLGQDITIDFRTRINPSLTGTVLVNYDDITGFWDPDASGSTTGTDAAATTFTLSDDRKVSGTASGKLDYTFVNSSGGVCRVFNSNKPDFGENTSSAIGVWVFGDLSYNKLEYWFYTDNTSSTNAIVVADTINWAGWELKTIPFSSINSSGRVLFHSIVVSQTPMGGLTGNLYFDDAQLILNTSTDTPDSETLSVSSFPNPFREINYLKYSLKKPAHVKVDIYDVLGHKIKTLYDDKQGEGSYILEWDGANENGARQAGIYMYRIEVTSATNAFQPVVRTIRCTVIE